jgi:putative transposase
MPIFAYPLAIRRVLYTTNAIESLNRQLRKVLKTRGHFPHDEAATKLLYLALRNIHKRWKPQPAPIWGAALPHFKVLFGTRVPDRA